jgi:hypothetical protein
MSPNIQISLFNSTGLPKQTITPILNTGSTSSLIFITETWLLPPNKYPTKWKQYHTYGTRLNSINTYRGQMGIALLVNPNFDLPVHHVPHDHPLLAKHTLSIIISSKILIHCLYLPPSLNQDTFSEILSLLPLTMANTTTTLICGDLNARMGAFTGDSRYNSKGRILRNWIDAQNLLLWNKQLALGQPTYYAYQGTSIIDYFLSTNQLQNPQLTIRDDLSLDSHHKFMTLSFKIPRLSANDYISRTPQRLMWSLRKLKYKDKVDRYREVFSKNLDLCTLSGQSSLITDRESASEFIEQINKQVCEAIYTSLDQVCGRQQQGSDDYLKDFWTDEMTNVFNLKEHYYKKWRKAHGLNNLNYWLLHQDTKAKLRRLVIQRRRETWRLFCNKMAQGEYTKAISKFSRIRKNRILKPTFSTVDGPQHSSNTMTNHLQQIYSGHLLPSQPIYTTQDHSDTIMAANPTFNYEDCPIDLDDVKEALKRLPAKKAPGVDHIRQEMLAPIAESIAQALIFLFKLCWQWSYTPLQWRVAQIVPIHKKGAHTEPANYRPISLTSVFRKLFERCLYPHLQNNSPPLDIAQGGFREARSTLDQTLCLAEICNLIRKKHHYKPVLAFLDIKSAYDTVDRNYIWHCLTGYSSEPLLNTLKNLFDDIYLEVLLNNTTSHRFSPKTGVLQGSILSPFLYSIYINNLPHVLRSFPLPSTPIDQPERLLQSINCLLYADDVVLIATPDKLRSLLTLCEIHSETLGYRWNPSKCVILDPSETHRPYTLYGNPIPQQDYFSYLGVPIKPGGYLDTSQLVQNNTNKALQTMNQLTSIGVNPKGFDRLLSIRFYTQIVRPQLEYGLAISIPSSRVFRQLESCQNTCIRRIFGGSNRSSVKVMLHLVKQPSMKDRVSLLQARFIFRAIDLPDDTLLATLLPHIQTSTINTQWYKLTRSPCWQLCAADANTLDLHSFRKRREQFLEDKLLQLREDPNSKLLSACRPYRTIDPILWLPMSHSERSRTIRWRLGWLPGGIPKDCPYHPNTHFSRYHATECLQMHSRLCLPRSIEDPLSFLLNLLPHRKPRDPQDASAWSYRWPVICILLQELDYLIHDKLPPSPVNPGRKLLEWLPK